MNTESFYALLRDIFTSLERFLIGFIAYLNGQHSEQQKLVLKSTEARLKAIKQKEVIKDEIKHLSTKDLDNNTIIDE